MQTKFKPFTIRVTATLSGSFKITEEDLEHIRWQAYQENSRSPLPRENPLDNEQVLVDLINELVESKLDIWSTALDFDDFDWNGVSWDEWFNAIRGLDANGEPLRPPELPGQISIDDVLTELV